MKRFFLYITITFALIYVTNAQPLQPKFAPQPPPIPKHLQESFYRLQVAESSISDSITAAQLHKIGYLAIAQSGVTPKPENQGRAGYWLLPYPIAVAYGLTINEVIDQRMQLEKSTEAAYRYWLDLAHILGSDSLADIAFTTSMLELRKLASSTTLITNISTANLYKLNQIKENYKNYKAIPLGPEVPVEEVASLHPIAFSILEKTLEISHKQLLKLNPQWITGVYYPAYGNLKLPVTYKSKFDENLAIMEQLFQDAQQQQWVANKKRIKQLKGDIPDIATHKPIRYKVKSGDNLGRIAQRYHVKISLLRSWNGLHSDRIYAGQKLIIYVPKNQKFMSVAKSTKTPPAKPKATRQFITYKVKEGDTLWGISQQFDEITADMIMEDNGISTNINPGQILKIRVLK